LRCRHSVRAGRQTGMHASQEWNLTKCVCVSEERDESTYPCMRERCSQALSELKKRLEKVGKGWQNPYPPPLFCVYDI
jgi:hypothetical protein